MTEIKKRQTEIIAIASGKGGTGKTMVAMCLGYALRQAGHKVLMIDADPGTDGLSHYLLGDEGFRFIKDFSLENTYRGILNGFLKSQTLNFETKNINRKKDHGVIYDALISGGRGIYGDMEDMEETGEKFSNIVVPPLSREQFRNAIDNLLTSLRDRERFDYDYIIVDTRGGFAFESTDICALSDSFILVTEAGYTSFYQDRKLVDHINASAVKMDRKTLMRAIILNKATDGEEKEYRLALEKEFELEYNETYPFPLDVEAIKSYKVHQIPYIKTMSSDFSCATLNAFSGIMRVVTAQWSEDRIDRWDELVHKVNDAYEKRIERDEQERREQEKRETKFNELVDTVEKLEQKLKRAEEEALLTKEQYKSEMDRADDYRRSLLEDVERYRGEIDEYSHRYKESIEVKGSPKIQPGGLSSPGSRGKMLLKRVSIVFTFLIVLTIATTLNVLRPWETSNEDKLTRLYRADTVPALKVKYLSGLYDSGERSFDKIDLSGLNLSGLQLVGVFMSNAILLDADLQKANLRGAKLRGADLQGANLWGADLRGTDLRGADLRGADLWGTDLRGAKLLDAQFSPGTLTRALTNKTTVLPDGSRGPVY